MPPSSRFGLECDYGCTDTCRTCLVSLFCGTHCSPHLYSVVFLCYTIDSLIVSFWQWILQNTQHSAAGWPLTKPLQCCSLRLERRGTALLLIFTYQQEGKGNSKLFALCAVDVTGEHTVEHYVEAVMDSTRYFVIRVKDEKTEREALIGLGFRERDESADFRAALQKYETDVAKERTQRAVKMTHQ
jgi:adaptin ear-binding coat-associated protein 1/2